MGVPRVWCVILVLLARLLFEFRSFYFQSEDTVIHGFEELFVASCRRICEAKSLSFGLLVKGY